MGVEEKIIPLSQKAYALCIMAMGIQQLAYGDIDPNFLPQAFSTYLVYRVLTYPWAIAFTLTGVSYLVNWRAYETALVSAGIFLVCFIFGYAPYMLFGSDVGGSFLQWAPAFETLAFTGSSLALAASFRKDATNSSSPIRLLEKLIPWGGAFFSVMLIGFGIDHFLYPKLVAGLVPAWILNPTFWTYLTGTALVGAGLSITFKIKLKLVASLLGIMLLLWCLFLHMPRAVHQPVANRGLELTRVFVTFGFSGIAFLFAYGKK
jgi:hypothetical protein